jgi:uncharacterized protein (TIGR02246 family)
MVNTNAADIHLTVEEAFNAGDVDRLVALYEPDAKMIGPDGAEAVGVEAIRQVWADLIAMGGRMTLTTKYAVEMGDVAMLRNHWEFKAEGLELSSDTAEVARRQADGTWRYIIDHPFGSSADLP